MQTLLLTYRNQIATLTLNRPESLNSINAQMFDELEQAFTQLSSDPNIRAIILTGSGDRAFAAGADIRGLAQTDAASGLAVSQRGQHVFAQIETCGKPTIAAINGAALGGGLELAMACTLRIASDRAKLGLPETGLGLIPGYGGTQRLPHLIGPGNALRLMLTAAIIDATEAYRLHLVEEFTTPTDLLPRANDLADTIAKLAPLAIAGVLEAVHRNTYAAEAEIFGHLSGTADKTEGLTAFLEKRPPPGETNSK